MKRSKIEKAIIGVIMASIIILSIAIYSIFSFIQKQGGIDKVIITIGKDTKHIIEEIKKD